MSLLISGATIIDGVASTPIDGQSILVIAGRIHAIGPSCDVDGMALAASARVVDARGKYVIPGLMDANVHLLQDMRLENLVRYEGHYGDLVAEAAQVTLKSGVTTAFDTWGPRGPLMAVREQINRGELTGSRIFCAGNIVGLDGPFSADFLAKAPEVASPALVERINALWVENVGPALSWMTAEQVVQEIRTYIGKGVDFVKYASSEHRYGTSTTFLLFAPQIQEALVDEVHRAGLTAQAHTMSVESLRVAVEAGCDLIQHCNITGPVPIPGATIELMAERKTGAVVFPFTQRRIEWMKKQGDAISGIFGGEAVDKNVHNLIRGGATLLLATDGGIWAPETRSDPFWAAALSGVDNLIELGEGHFHWFKAMEEKGLPPMELLKAATINIARAYKKDKELGTLEAGKIADLIILDRDPLESAENYRRINMVIKEGGIVDRSRLPLRPVLTKPAVQPSPEVLAYRAHNYLGKSRHPVCC